MPNELSIADPHEVLDPEETDRFFHEINLLRIEGCYFSFNRNRRQPAAIEKETFVDGIKTGAGNIETSITIEPHPSYGKPSTLAYKIFQVVLKKYSEYGYPFPEGVPLGQREIARLIGRKTIGGSDSLKFNKAVKQLRRTGIECSFYVKEANEKKQAICQWRSVDFSIFTTALMSGRKEGQVEQGFFCLHPIIVNSLNNRYTFCLNFSRMKELEPIGFAIFKRLFFHFSNIYSQDKSRSFTFTKDYGSICKSWLGSLKVLKFKSKIINEQLGPHLKAVKKTELLRRYDIEKNTKGDGFNLIYYPGKAFFEDYRRFYGCSPQLQLPFRKASEKRYIQQPMALVSYFYEKLLSTEKVNESFLLQTEVDFASSLLETNSYEDIRAWIDYSIEQAQKTGFAMKTFGGIKNYKTEFFVKKDQLQATKIKAQECTQKQIEQHLRDKYEIYKRDCIETYENNLSKDKLINLQQEEVKLQEEAKQKYPNSQLPAKMHFRQARREYLVQQACVLSFDEWLKKQKI